MNYLETTAYIESLSPTLEHPTTARIAAFGAEHGMPQNAYPSFHIGGTNGKGSTAVILDSLLRTAGLRVGRFTGPHLLRWNERFHVDGVAIDDADFARIATQVRKQSESFAKRFPQLGPLTWFEVLTAIAFFYFRERRIDVGVFEVGLGGRFDATNVLQNVLCSAVTNIDLDHTHILGETEEAIAFEKSGIFKKGVPVVTAASGSALEVLKARARDAEAPLFHCQSAESRANADALWTGVLKQFDRSVGRLSLLGEHQKVNALVAVACLYQAGAYSELFRREVVDELLAKSDSFIQAFADVYWPGRMQPVPNMRDVFFDGAHNPAGGRTLRSSLDRMYGDRPAYFILSCFANKNAESMLSALVRAGDRLFISEAATRRATISKQELASAALRIGAQSEIYRSIPDAFAAALAQRGAGHPIVAAGSFATVREIMTSLGWQCVEDGLQQCAKIAHGGLLTGRS